MFDWLLERNERQLRLEKSKIYKEMLDNQILLNEQYRKKQLANSRAKSDPKKVNPSAMPRQSLDKMHTE